MSEQQSATASFEQGHALVVGVGADLPNTVDDAVGLADILRDTGRCAYPPDHVHLLTGESATREHILGGLDALSKSTDPGSTVLVHPVVGKLVEAAGDGLAAEFRARFGGR